MEARSHVRSDAVSVLVAWADPSGAPAAARIGDAAFRQAYESGTGDIPSRLRAALTAAEGRLSAQGASRSRRSGAGGRATVRRHLVGLGAVVLDHDCAWTMTLGAVDAYVVRDARIASIGRAPMLDGGPPPAGEAVRTSLVAGDTLLLCSRDLIRELGPEELKSAALTLHPAAAAAHLRRLFATLGGRGSDAALAIDANVSSDGRRLRRTDGGGRSAAVERSAAPPARRAALGLASFVSVIAIVGLLVVLLPRGEERVAAQHLSLDASAAAATEHVTRAENVASSDPAAALGLYRAAWDALDGANPLDGGPGDAHAALATRITAGLDSMRGGAAADVRTLTAFQDGLGGDALSGFVQGPDDDLYVIDTVTSVVTRIDAEDGERVDIVHRGDRAADAKARIGRPVQLERAGEALLILDDDARLWRWASSGGDGTLNPLDLGDDDWSASVGDIATRPDPNGVRVYLVDPEAQNILRFQPTFDGRSYSRSDYLVVDDEAVSGFRQLHIDERVYVLDPAGVRRYEFGRAQQFRLGVPPDHVDIRPGHDYRLIAGADRNGTQGHLYLYDDAWDRIVVFDKVDGAYVRQWTTAPGDPSMQDMLGLAVTTGTRREPDTLHWLTPSGVYEAVVPWAVPAEEDHGEREGRREGRRKGRAR